MFMLFEGLVRFTALNDNWHVACFFFLFQQVTVETGFTAAHIPSSCKGNAFRAGSEAQGVTR